MKSIVLTIKNLLVVLSLACQPCLSQAVIPDYLESANWDTPSRWQLNKSANGSIGLQTFNGQHSDGLLVNYEISPSSADVGWVVMGMDSIPGFTADKPLSLLIRTGATDDMEVKFIDKDGSVFGKRFSMRGNFQDWTGMVIYLDNTRYWWGGNNSFGELDHIELAFSGDSSGTVYIDEIGLGRNGLLPGILLDPYREATGTGYTARRSPEMNAEDPLVLEYLETVQDSSTAEAMLLPSMEDSYISTFNNALAAMVFILKGEKERAERILDYFAAATDITNQDQFKQNFFYNGEARGFFQQVTLPGYRAGSNEDRWMGDMAWLLLAFKQYEQQFGVKNEYTNVVVLIRNLLISFFKPEGPGGYIQSGWQNGDTRLHESQGHPEGNIDCYAVFKACGEDYYAHQVRLWLDSVLFVGPVDTGTGLYLDNNFPLDLYTWRVLSLGEQYKDLLNIPDFDLRYRQSLSIKNHMVMGFMVYPNPGIHNMWLDGTGHIACAYQAYGDINRGYFYANQLDSLLVEYQLHGRTIRSLPYTTSKAGGYSWVDTTKGFVSAACWYIFAKNGFNPMDFDGIPNNFLSPSPSYAEIVTAVSTFPNPFKVSIDFCFTINWQSKVRLQIYSIDGRLVSIPADEIMIAGPHTITWNAMDRTGIRLPEGLYLYQLSIGPSVNTGKLILMRN